MPTIDLNPIEFQPLIDAAVKKAIGELEKRNGRISYSETEAAEVIGVSPHCLRDCRYRGEIKATKLGKAWLYRRSDLIAFLESGETNR